MKMAQAKQVSKDQTGGRRLGGRRIHPNVVGVLVVIAVMALPGVPVGYLTPGAVFLGALGVYGTELLQRRSN